MVEGEWLKGNSPARIFSIGELASIQEKQSSVICLYCKTSVN